MSIRSLSILLLAVCCTLALALPDMAEAARMGGGRSFGSKPFMSTPAQAPRPSGLQNSAASRQQARQPGAAAARPGGMFGGMGGLFGGLLAGTLIGSLLSGQGFAGGGGFMDILIFGLLIYLGLKLFAAFRNRRQAEPAAAGPGYANRELQHGTPDNGMSQRSDMGWDALRDGREGAAAASGPAPSVPEGFDTEEFLRGAKMAYTRLQQSWDRRDMADIAQFTTPAVQEALRRQMADDPAPSQTEILLVNAQLLEVAESGDGLRAQVYFDTLLRERPDQSTPNSAREIWHFLRQGAAGNWKLDGIQQVE